MRFVLVVLLLGTCAWAAPDVEQAQLEPALARLTAQLGDIDPARREQAADELRRQGQQARAALLSAMRQPNPEIAGRAATLLLELPWHTPDDPPPVQKILHDYGKGDLPARIAVVAQLNELPRAMAGPALLRLLQEDPSAEIAWNIVSMIRQNPDADTLARVRQIDTTHARAPVLVLVGRAELNTNHRRAMELLNRAVDASGMLTERDDGELDIAINILASRATHLGHIDQALRLRRLAARRAALVPSGHPMGAALEVLALHADHGPRPDLAEDLQRFTRHRGQSEFRYGLGRIFANNQMGLAAGMCYLAGHAASNHSVQVRLRIAERLSSVGWNDLARAELHAILSSAREPMPLHHINANLRLASLANEEKDHAQAAEHLQATLDLIGREAEGLVRNRPGGRTEAFQTDQLRAQTIYHRFMASRKTDPAAAETHAAALLELAPTDTDVVLELVDYLQHTGRPDDAERAFLHAQGRIAVDLAAHPASPALKNELAWLNARSGLRVQEGYDLAEKAVALEPDNAAFIDTLAEAAFRLGKVQMAIDLEERALELRPGDAFMIEQLHRFRAGLNGQGSDD
jgi:tetratricopeptide (TPR) repeat protein